VSVPDDGTLAERVRRIAEDLSADRSYDGGTHSDACWQWHAACALHRAAVELEHAARWKAEATEVLAQWDRVHEALGSPGQIGLTKAGQALLEVRRLQHIIDNSAPEVPT
jgi:hypothetical protein